MTKLQKKIKYEFQCFYFDQMRTSKENIFAHSQEIEVKKRLLNDLSKFLAEVDEETAQLLQLQNNLLESAYSFWQDIQQESEDKETRAMLFDWLTFVVKGGRNV